MARTATHRSARFGPFRLDVTTGELRKHDRRIPLQDQPFKLLVLLLEHAGEMVTRDDIRQRLWGDDTTVVFESSVATAVRKLRQALGDRVDRPHYIETLARRGYRWLAPLIWDEVGATGGGGQRLVGRAAPLAALRDSLRRARAGERQLVLITGEAGLGKTALITAFEREVAGTVRSASGHCVEEYGASEPYYAMLDAIGELCRGPRAADVIATLATYAPTWLAQFPALINAEQRDVLKREIQGLTRERMRREICDALEALAIEQPLLLVLEDLHWSDPWTIDLLAAIARRRTRSQLMLVGTSRPIDPAAALSIVSNDLLVHGLAQEVPLAPLTESDLVDYLSIAGSTTPASHELARVVYLHSDGNPLFMVAALDHLERLGLITRTAGTFQASAPLEQIDIGVPETLRQLVDVQVARLSHDEQAALEVAAVAGASFLAAVCAPALDMAPETAERVYEALATRHQFVRRASAPAALSTSRLSRYEFEHDLYRDVLYRRSPAGRRTTLHQQIAGELERLGSTLVLDLSDVAPEIAQHFEAAGDWRRTAKYLELMAETAGRVFVPRDATTLLQRALELVSRLPDADRASLELPLLRKLAGAYVVSFDPRAVDTYERLIARSAHFGSIAGEIRGLIGIAYPVSWVSTSRGLDALQRALSLSEALTDPIQRARLRASCLVRRIWAGGWNAQDAADCRLALDTIRAAGDRRVLASHLVDCSFIDWVSSEYRIARQHVVEGLAILWERPQDNPYLSFPYWENLFILPWSLLFLGEWGDMLRELDEGIVNAHKNGDDFRAQTLRLYQAWLHLFAMDFSGAVQICESILPMLDRPERTPWRRFCLVVAGSGAAAVGDEPRAREHLTRASREMASHTVIHDWYIRLMLDSALTELALARHDLPQTRESADRWLAGACDTAEHTWQALAWDARARVAAAEDDRGRALECLGRAFAAMEGFDTPLAAWRVQATAAGLMARDGLAEDAARHHDVGRATIHQLADSLPVERPLRDMFLAEALRRLESPLVESASP